MHFEKNLVLEFLPDDCLVLTLARTCWVWLESCLLGCYFLPRGLTECLARWTTWTRPPKGGKCRQRRWWRWWLRTKRPGSNPWALFGKCPTASRQTQPSWWPFSNRIFHQYFRNFFGSRSMFWFAWTGTLTWRSPALRREMPRTRSFHLLQKPRCQLLLIAAEHRVLECE